VSAIRRTFVLMAVAVTLVAPDTGAHAATAAHIDVGVKMALRVLYASSAGARALRSKAKAILVFLLWSRRRLCERPGWGDSVTFRKTPFVAS
jgi:hypothetical protein